MKIFNSTRPTKATILLIALIFSVFTPMLIQSSAAAEPPATGMHKTIDIFKGSFSRRDVTTVPNKAFDVSFSIRPTMDVPNTVIRFIMPADLVRLVKGKSMWKGDVKKGETVNLKFSIAAMEEVDANVRVDVEASPSGKTYSSSYYLHVTTLAAEIASEEGGHVRALSPEAEIPAVSDSESTRAVESPESPIVFVNPESPGTFRIKGRWWYINENGGYSVGRYMLIEIWDYDTTSADDYLAGGWTDGNGYFDITAPNDDGWLAGTADPYVRFYAVGRWDWITKTSGGSTYWWRYPGSGSIRDNVPDGWVKDIGGRYPLSSNEALQAGDACYAEAQWIYNRVSWMRYSRVDIRWPKESWPHCHGDSIHLPSKSTASWNHVTVHHEYAHAVMWDLYGNSWPNGFQGGTHWVYMEDVLPDAWTEGWAEFMQCAVDNNPNNLQGAGHNIETNDWYNYHGSGSDSGDMDGAYVEGEVASILWDINDPKSTADKDYMYWGFNEIFTVLRYGDAGSDDNPNSAYDFWTDWLSRWPDLTTSKGPLSTIYWHYGIDRDYYSPYAGSISINAGATYTTSKYVTLTLSCKDWGSGVAKMRFLNSGGTWSGWYTYATSKSWTLIPGDGTKRVYVQFKDKKGYTSSSYSDTIILDTLKPTGSIKINAGATYTTSRSVTLYLTYSDATSGVYRVRYANTGGSWTSWMSPSATKAWTLTTGDGNKVVNYQIRDRAGWISLTYWDSIILDTTKPTGSIKINAGATYTTSTSVTLSLTYSDATSGVDKVRYRNAGGSWTIWLSPSATKAWTLPTGDGTKTVYYEIRDKAGWISSTYSDKIYLTSATFKIWTDKTAYKIGETMRVYVRVTNPGPPLPVRALINLRLPDGSIYGPLLDMTVTIPSGFDSGDVLWNSFTIPGAPLGNYAWIAELKDPGTGELITRDTANWQLSA